MATSSSEVSRGSPHKCRVIALLSRTRPPPSSARRGARERRESEIISKSGQIVIRRTHHPWQASSQRNIATVANARHVNAHRTGLPAPRHPYRPRRHGKPARIAAYRPHCPVINLRRHVRPALTATAWPKSKSRLKSMTSKSSALNQFHIKKKTPCTIERRPSSRPKRNDQAAQSASIAAIAQSAHSASGMRRALHAPSVARASMRLPRPVKARNSTCGASRAGGESIDR